MLMHSMAPTVGTFAGFIVEPTDVLTMDIHIPMEVILTPTEDILTASEDILVRFTFAIVISGLAAQWAAARTSVVLACIAA
jgi:hypothetical protein